MDAYKQAGFENRSEYLKSVADDFNVPVEFVFDLASVLGPDEDFDALISAVENYPYPMLGF